MGRETDDDTGGLARRQRREAAGEHKRIAVSFGPLHGPISARQVEDVLRELTFAPQQRPEPTTPEKGGARHSPELFDTL